MPASRKDIVIEFLMTAVATATGEKYKAAASDFKLELDRRGVSWDTLDGEEQDWTLAEYLVEGYYSERSRPWGVTLASSLQKMAPARRLKTAWKVLDTWAIHSPTQQALPCPKEVALACAVLLVARQDWMEGTAVLLCFVGLLRISESLKMLRSDMVLGESTLILLLGRTKTGQHQRVVISNAAVVNYVKCWLTNHPGQNGERLCPISYSTFSKWLHKLCRALGVASFKFRSHSFRRDGATTMFTRGQPLTTTVRVPRTLGEWWRSLARC